MPRGVPASGKRRTVPIGTFEQDAETTVAGGTVDDPFGIYETSEEEDPPVVAPAESLTMADMVEPMQEPAGPVELSPEQVEIKALRDQLARLSGKKDVEPVEEELTRPGDSGNILIHFLADGFTALGKVWYRGQELEFEPDSRAYKDTFDRRGVSWLSLRNDDFAQVERWGVIFFRPGPWPGKTYADGQFEPLKQEKGDGSVRPPSAEELAAAEKARQRRAAPRLPSLTNAAPRTT